MFATRNDQENLVNNHQQAAAAKPLNQGIKGFGAKTPAPKTPFRIPLNDENAVGAGKSGLKVNGKSKENGGLGGKKGAEAARDTFVTPAGPRTRAPLGMKTTNAKARAFQTPAPLTVDNKLEKTLQKTVSPRLKRAKVKVLQAEPVTLEADVESEPEIEFIPPKEVPLPDYPESDTESDSYFGPNKTYPMFEGENFTRGMNEIYYDPVDGNGERLSEKRDRIALAQHRAKQEIEIARQLKADQQEEDARMRAELGMLPPKSVMKRSTPTPPAGQILVHASKAKSNTSSVNTLASRSAVAALAAPTKASLARQQEQPLAAGAKLKGLSNGKTRDPLASKPSNAQNVAGIAASRSTVGYNKGRVMSSTMRSVSTTKKPSSKNLPPSRSVSSAAKENQETSKPKAVSTLPSLTSLGLDDEDLDDDLSARPPLFDDDGEEELFQFKLDG